MAKKPRLLVISQVYVPDPASVGQHMADAAAGMAARGCDVRVLTSARGYADPSVKYPLRETRDGVEIIRLPFSSFGKRTILLRVLGQVLFLLQVLLRGLFTPRLSAILVSTSPPFASIVAVIIGFIRRVPIKYWLMDLNPDQVVALGAMSEKALAVRVFRFFNRVTWRSASDIIALDRFMAERVTSRVEVADKITIMPPWPHESSDEPLPHEENPFRREHELGDKFVVMYSGNHSPANPIDTAVEAALRLRDREDIVFMFIGGGNGKAVVDEAIAEHNPPNIVSLPYQPFEEIRNSLSAADVHLVSVGDNMVGVVHPCKVYGALALARPVLLLGPDPCHVSDIIANHDIGWHFRHGEVDRAVQLIEELADRPREEMRQLGLRAAQVASEQFSPEPMIDDFCKIIARGMELEQEQPAPASGS